VKALDSKEGRFFEMGFAEENWPQHGDVEAVIHKTHGRWHSAVHRQASWTAMVQVQPVETWSQCVKL
jgi:hypothetical protein